MSVRAARSGDATGLAGLYTRAWAWAYTDLVPPEAFEPEATEAREEGLRAALDVDGRQTLVFDQDGLVAGFAVLGPSQDVDAGPKVGELAALYVEPLAQGAGTGRTLLSAAEEALRATGFAEATLWVFTANWPARDMYERRGWRMESDGAAPERCGWAPAVRYRRSL